MTDVEDDFAEDPTGLPLFSKEPISSWRELTLEHVLVAYRKAKVDCFLERAQFDALAFAAFEEHLAENLDFIWQELRRGNLEFLLRESLVISSNDPNQELGEMDSAPLSDEDLEALSEPKHPAHDRVLFERGPTVEVVAKKLRRERKDGVPDGHAFFSNPKRTLHHLEQSFELSPELRLMGRFSVLGHVLSALWINLVGHKFDACLSADAYGSRVRRYRPSEGRRHEAVGTYHLDGLGSFSPYFVPYRKWRENGSEAMRTALKQDKAVIALSLDLSNYYHRIDPTFFALPQFQAALGVKLTAFERAFTQGLADALSGWSAYAATKLQADARKGDPVLGGLPIGLSCTRIISNVLLAQLDQQIRSEVAPLYYGRYVDDIILVIEDPWGPGKTPSLEEVFGYIAKRVPCFKPDKPAARKGKTPSNGVNIEFAKGYAGESHLCLQTAKQKMFCLEGQPGLDLLQSIEHHVSRVASERRLLPDVDGLEDAASAQVLTATGDATEEADTLRRADGLSVRRLGWAIQLANVESLARDLERDDWSSQRRTFYQFARNHVLAPHRFLDHVDYLPRLLELAVSLCDWQDATKIYQCARESLKQLGSLGDGKRVRVNGYEAKDPVRAFMLFEKRVTRVCAEAFLRAARRGIDFPSDALALAKALGLGSQSDIATRSARLCRSDLARVRYVDAIDDEECIRDAHDGDLELERAFPRWAADAMRRFLSKRAETEKQSRVGGGRQESLIPYIFPTRPLTARCLARLDDSCVADAAHWARLVRAFRGAWVRPVAGTPNPDVILLGGTRKSEVTLGITSLKVLEKTWRTTAAGGSDVGIARYRSIRGLVNQAVRATPRPDYLLLPELSLPRRWLDTIAKRLRPLDIGLIAGMDYRHYADGQVRSEAILLLSDDRLGFSTIVEVRQPKLEPAREEEETLLRDFGKNWFRPERSAKQVISHGGFDFGVLVCSELQNIGHRARFQGKVDCVIVLSWNKDLDTFSALIESAALDVHAYIALVNNRAYGDSRVRSPAKRAYERDLVRLRGGECDYLTVAKLDLSVLRAFQSREKAWARENDPFKPVPEGFDIAPRRRDLPR